MPNNPKISVLLPVYNSELYIKEAIDSILNQTFSDFELLVIDDASTNTSVEIIQSYTDSRIQLIVKSQNSGYTNSLNHGLTIAKGEYIARMDSDDISMPTRFEKQIAFLDNNTDYVLCGANFSILESNEVKILPENHDDIQMQFIANCCIAHPVVMLRKSVFLENKIQYNAEKEPAEDYDLWVRLLQYGKLHNIQEVLLRYRVHNMQTSNLKATKQAKNSLDIKLDLFKYLKPSFNEIEETVYRKRMSNLSIDLNELEVFKSINQEILGKNLEKKFFNHLLLSNYFNKFEKQLLFKYFYNRQKYKPTILIQYLEKRKTLQPKFTFKDELKLVLKCLIFYKTK